MPQESRGGRLGKTPSHDRPESGHNLTAILTRPPFPFRLSTADCTALARCVAATTVVKEWRDHNLWGNQWHAFDLPQRDAQHPCIGCPLLQVAKAA